MHPICWPSFNQSIPSTTRSRSLLNPVNSHLSSRSSPILIPPLDHYHPSSYHTHKSIPLHRQHKPSFPSHLTPPHTTQLILSTAHTAPERSDPIPPITFLQSHPIHRNPLLFHTSSFTASYFPTQPTLALNDTHSRATYRILHAHAFNVDITTPHPRIDHHSLRKAPTPLERLSWRQAFDNHIPIRPQIYPPLTLATAGRRKDSQGERVNDG